MSECFTCIIFLTFIYFQTDEKKSSIKDVHSSFIRSSLRKFKMRKKKSGGMDSTEVTPTSVKKQNVGAPPPISPKKSPKKINSSRSSHSSDTTDPKSNSSFTKDFNIEAEEVYFRGNVADNLHGQHGKFRSFPPFYLLCLI